MPNWHYSTLIIHGTVANMNEFYHENKSTMRELDFNQVMPSKQDANWYENNIKNWGTKWNAQGVECNTNLINSQTKLVYKYQTAWGQAGIWWDKILEKYGKLVVFRMIEESESWDGVRITDYVNGEVITSKTYNNAHTFYWDYYSSHIPKLMEILLDNGVVPNGNIIAEMKYEDDEHWPTRKYQIDFIDKHALIDGFMLTNDNIHQIFCSFTYIAFHTISEDDSIIPVYNIDTNAINMDEFAVFCRESVWCNPRCNHVSSLSNYKQRLLSDALFTSYLIIGINGTTISFEQMTASLAALNEDTLYFIWNDYREKSKSASIQLDDGYLREINDNKTCKQQLDEYKETYFNVILEMTNRCNCYQQLCDVWNKEIKLNKNEQIFVNKAIQLIECKRIAIRYSDYGSEIIESLLQVIDLFIWNNCYLYN